MIRTIDPVSPAVDSVESALATIPNPVPTSGDVRIARSHVLRPAARAIRGLRRPLLAGLGGADLVLEWARLFLRPGPPRE
jgi:hypothetical protein